MIRSNIWRVYFFSFFTMFLVFIPVFVPYCLGLGLSMQQFFHLQAAFGLGIVLLEVPTGYLSDLWGRKKTLIVGGFFTGCGMTWLLFAKDFWSLLVFELTLSVGFSFISGADIAMLYDSLKGAPDERAAGTHAIANHQFYQTLAESIASVLGGVLAISSFRSMLWVNAFTAWLPFVVALGMKEPPIERLSAESHKDNFRVVYRHIFHGDPMLRLSFVNLVVWGLSTFFAVWILQKYWNELGIPLASFGFIWAAYNFVVGIAGKQVHRLEHKWGATPLLFFAALAPIVTYFALTFGKGWWGVALGLGFYLARGVTQVLIKDAFNWRVPSHFRSTAHSIHSLFFRLGFAVFGPVIGYLLDHRGVRFTWASVGSLFLGLFFVTMLPLIRAVRTIAHDHIPVPGEQT